MTGAKGKKRGLRQGRAQQGTQVAANLLTRLLQLNLTSSLNLSFFNFEGWQSSLRNSLIF